MKDLLSKEHYCYKIYTLLMKTSAYLLFYRQLTPSAPPPHMAIWATPPSLQKNLDLSFKFFLQKSQLSYK